MKKYLILFMIFCQLIVTVAVYSSGKKEQEAAAAPQKIALLIHPTLYKATGGENGVIKDFIQQTGIDVEITTLPTDQLHEKIVIEYLAGTGRYDVATLVPWFIGGSGITNYLEPLDAFIKKAPKDYKPEEIIALDTLRFPPPSGPLRGILFRTGTTMLYYRGDLFDQKGIPVPQTWEEFLTAAQKLTIDVDGDGKIDITGCSPRFQGNNQSTETFMRWLLAHGGDVVSDDLKQSRLNSKEAEQTLQDLYTVVKSGWAPKNALEFGRDDQIRALQVKNGAAMAITFQPYWSDIINPKNSEVYMNIRGALVPTSPGVPKGRTLQSLWILSIDQKSKSKDAAWKLIEFLTNPKNQLTMAMKYGNGPTQSSVFENPEFIKNFPVAKLWLQSLKVALPAPSLESWAKAEAAMGEEIQATMLGKQSVKQGIQNMHAKITELLK